MPDAINWQAPALSPEDDRIVSAYLDVGKSVDDLPYTDDFDRLVDLAGYEPSQKSDQRYVFRRLLTLRKQGRLPRAYAVR
ncbi:MAG: hypothetical protein AAF561_10200 [Planctomycetota bacterium]